MPREPFPPVCTFRRGNHEQNLCSGAGGAGPVRRVARGGSGATRHDVRPGGERHWDTAWFVGWRGVDKSDLAPDWNDWYDVAAFSGSAGRYLTPHLKIDLDVSTTTTGRVYGQEPFGIPGPLPYYQLRSYGFRRTTVAPSLAYQFFENRWVHPFLGAGIEGIRESERLDVQFLPPGGPRPLPPTREARVRVLGAALHHRWREVLRVGTRVHSHRHADDVFIGRR